MSVTRREFLRNSAVGSLALSVPGAAGAALRKPLNLLYIMTDQHPLGGVEGYGNPLIRTPALRKLAARGATLGNMYIAAFPCSPSRACQLTGRYAHDHGVITNDVLLRPDVPALGDICAAAGYATAHIGKWHLGGNMYVGRRVAPGVEGRETGNWHFGVTRGETDWQRSTVVGGCSGEDAPQHGFQTWRGGWKDYHDWLRRTGRGHYLRKGVNLGNHDDLPSGPEGTHIYSRLHEDHHMAAFFAEEAEAFVRANAGRRPWAAVLSFYGPHLPVAPPKPWDTMYSLDDVTLPASNDDDLRGKPLGQRGERTYRRGAWSAVQYKDYIRRYWGYCSYIDKQIDRVFSALSETGQWQNTMVVFTSDHGDMVGAHGMIFKLGKCGYEELHHVPGLLHVPGTTSPGTRIDALTSNVDLLPTFLDAAGLPAPDGLHGKSMLPVLAGTTNGHREAVFCDVSNASIACRAGVWKYTLNWRGRDRDELYHLADDPGEMENLAADERHKKQAEAMRERVYAWLRDTGHPFAETIIAEGRKDPLADLLDLSARVEDFEDQGNGTFRLSIVWRVNRALKPKPGRYWAFTQFLKGKEIAFRFTPYPEPPFTGWQAGKEYRVGPVTVSVPKGASGAFSVKSGFYDPTQGRSPGVYAAGPGNGLVLGTLDVRRKAEAVESVSFTPAP